MQPLGLLELSELIFGALTTVCAGLGLYVANLTLGTSAKAARAEARASELQIALTIFERINYYWDLIITLDKGTELCDYYLGQFYAQVEVACSLFNRGNLGDSAKIVLGDIITEVMLRVPDSEIMLAAFDNCLSCDDSMSETMQFLRKHAKADQFKVFQQKLGPNFRIRRHKA